jgi:hypothetical protein
LRKKGTAMTPILSVLGGLGFAALIYAFAFAIAVAG